jgi:type II secretory pathway pseudopilin PulG
MVLVLIVAVILFKRFQATAAGQRRIDEWKMKAPLLGRVIRLNLYSQFARTLCTLLQNGVPVLTALKITEQVISNRVIKEATAKARDAVTDGKTLAQPLAQSKVFPQLMVDLVKIGEETGDVAGALNNVAETYENELNIALRVMTNLIEPALIIAMAVVVGFLLVAVLGAMFSMISNIGNSAGVERRGQVPRGGRVFRSRPSTLHPRRAGAFTLLEIMMVVAIIGLMMTMSVPAILRTMHQEPLRKAVNDVMNICSHARAQAILQGVPVTVVFHPLSRRVALAGVATTNSMAGFISPAAPDSETKTSASSTSSLNSTQFADSINIDMLDINLLEYKGADEAWVRFFPNGTSDEMTLILHADDQYRKITLEVTTGLASMEVMQ